MIIEACKRSLKSPFHIKANIESFLFIGFNWPDYIGLVLILTSGSQWGKGGFDTSKGLNVRPIHTCIHLDLNVLILIELSDADRLTSCFCILASRFICMSRPNGFTILLQLSILMLFSLAYGEACSLQEQESNLAKLETQKGGGTDLFSLKAKMRVEFWAELLCWPQNVSLQPHTSYYKDNVHHLCSAPCKL